ncbi:hypothetical protein Sps_02493 [Shewanella psychrophila]|uniref:Uncharacterized protein n=1 Tax=Shewanella psychrophila TaxID=225848 RepID=A0A1S6HQ37_9GAMM|nr:hypothetical protein [Shewanella psychrophila]AQS37647.1 hypothetical protein Sps_02493 [Shewanella psychrophila]
MSEIQVTPMPAFMPIQGAETKMLDQALSQSPIAAKAIKSQGTDTTSLYLFSSGSRDPLALIDSILSKYITDQTKLAETKADAISKKSEAIAEINRLWGLIMSDRLPNTKPGDNKTTSLNGGKASDYLLEIDVIIKQQLGNSEGIKEIVGSGGMSQNVTYDQLQSMNATMTAYCDTIQVDLDTEQQEFKNVMTEITSAQEEIRDVRRSIISISQGG